MPFPRRGLYAVTDSELLAPARLVDAVEAAILGGAVVVQYRDKVNDRAQRHHQADALLQVCRRHEVPLIINDDLQLAAAVGADGIHLGRDDAPIKLAREQLGPTAILGVSCYNQATRAYEAQADGADYVAFGRFYASSTKPAAVQSSPKMLREVAPRLSVPIVVIGGITPENGASLLQAGADLLAVVGGLFDTADPRVPATKYAQLFA
ncbi:MAG: thiamine phosphate synthase [Gammaproteobacteria bacterium]|nr:thiamine phosphate synthase [Gammaproteobacteria bacterium]